MANKPEGEKEEEVAVHEGDSEVDEPPKYAVLLHNDDYSTMEFVIEVLMKFFKKSIEESTKLMLQVHTQGKAVAGIYSRDIAETKVSQVTQYAKTSGFPLKVTTEPAV